MHCPAQTRRNPKANPCQTVRDTSFKKPHCDLFTCFLLLFKGKQRSGRLEFFKVFTEMLETRERVCVNESLRISQNQVPLEYWAFKKKENILHCKCGSTIQYFLVFIKDGVRTYTLSNKSYSYRFMKDQRVLAVKNRKSGHLNLLSKVFRTLRPLLVSWKRSVQVCVLF